MNNYNDIKKYVEQHKGILTIKDFKSKKISYYFINKLIFDNIIEKVSRGMYNKIEDFEDEYFIMQQKYKRMVFSFNTALFFLEKTEVTPYRIDITVPNGYNVHRMQKNIASHYVSKKYLYLGAEKTKTPFGNEVISYNLERTICDIIRSNNTGLDTEQINKVIRNAFLKNQISISLLMDYAKKLKCERKIQTITEVLV